MKKIIYVCIFILSLGLLAACSKDEPGDSSKVNGNFKVDGKKVNLKYGYVFHESSWSEYTFFDKDILKYLDNEDFEYSRLFVSYDRNRDMVDEVSIDYKADKSQRKGIYYDNEESSLDQYVRFKETDGKIECSSSNISVEGYDGNRKYLGIFEASFSVKGHTRDMTDFDHDFSLSESIILTEVTDPAQIAFLKSLNEERKMAVSIR